MLPTFSFVIQRKLPREFDSRSYNRKGYLLCLWCRWNLSVVSYQQHCIPHTDCGIHAKIILTPKRWRVEWPIIMGIEFPDIQRILIIQVKLWIKRSTGITLKQKKKINVLYIIRDTSKILSSGRRRRRRIDGTRKRVAYSDACFLILSLGKIEILPEFAFGYRCQATSGTSRRCRTSASLQRTSIPDVTRGCFLFHERESNETPYSPGRICVSLRRNYDGAPFLSILDRSPVLLSAKAPSRCLRIVL